MSILAVTNEVVEDLKLVATFKKQVSERTYKIWPEQPLEPGEYAVVQYSEGALNWQAWDLASENRTGDLVACHPAIPLKKDIDSLAQRSQR
jgi:hypothetical protein